MYFMQINGATDIPFLGYHALESQNCNGQTALIVAATNGYLAQVRLLLAHGAEINKSIILGTAQDYAMTTFLVSAEKFKKKPP